MRKKLVLLTCLFCLMFSSLVFADELTDEKVLSTMDIDNINRSLEKAGLKSINLSPEDDSINHWHGTFVYNGVDYNTIENGASFDGYNLYIRVVESDITQNNVVKFTLPSYGDLSGNYIINRGSCDGVEISGRTVTIYNPHDTTNSANASDLIIYVGLNEVYTNDTGNAITFSMSSSLSVLSSGTELLETLVSYFTVNQVVVILAAAVGSCITLVFMWWGVRKMAYAIMSAFKKGKLRI